MALQTRLSNLAVNTQAAALGALLDGGYVDVMSGTQPESPDTPFTDAKVLVTMSFGSPAFLEPKNGSISANPLVSGVADRQGEPTWFRAYKSDHKTAVLDGSAGKTGVNMVLPVNLIVPGMTVLCSSLTHTVAKSMIGV